MNNRIKLNPKFKNDTPVLPDVTLIEEWGYYDGPLFGLCEINGQKLFFMDIVYDIWRYYEDNTSQRLWCIYGVYDINVYTANDIITSGDDRVDWQRKIIEDESECIGIFWEYDNLCKNML